MLLVIDDLLIKSCMGENTFFVSYYGLDAAFIRKLPGQAARLPRRRGDREQEVVLLNSKKPVPGEGKNESQN